MSGEIDSEYPNVDANKTLDEILQELEAKLKLMAPAPWTFSASQDRRRGHVDSKLMTICTYDPNDPSGHTSWKYNNFKFIADAPTDVEMLIKALRTAMSLTADRLRTLGRDEDYAEIEELVRKELL
jgi:hypothetical protein